MSKHYNTGMIRDFLEHLMWEIRAECIENKLPSQEVTFENGLPVESLDGVNPEVAECLERFMRRYGGAVRMGLAVSTEDAANEKEAERVLAEFTEWQGRYSKAVLEALEFLAPEFEEALACAVRRGIGTLQVNCAGLQKLTAKYKAALKVTE